GTNKVYAIAASSGFAIQDVLVDGVSQGAIASYTFTNVIANHTISATFAVVNYSITATSGANGSITPAGVSSVASGTNKVYTIAAASGYAIQDVLVDGVSKGVITSFTFTNVIANHTISATFAVVNYSITATSGANGSVTPAGVSSVASGTNKTYSITANNDYVIQDVLIDGVSQGAIASYTFNTVVTNHTISATFSAGLNTLQVTAAEAITPNGDGINDTWVINNIENYPNAVVRVFNRWGAEVFFARNYQNNWDARNKNNQTLPEGSYYYQINFESTSKANQEGWIYINR
ncbi:gliding motility-associated C-terminal domain-containing protein, partial [Flavobacterium muglaense]